MDLSQNAVLYGDVMLSQDVFYTSNTVEMKLVAGIFETAKAIAELKLTETELALYQSLVLLWPGRNLMKIAQFLPTLAKLPMKLTSSMQIPSFQNDRAYVETPKSSDCST